MSEQNHILDIISIINKNYRGSEDKAVLFIIGDIELGKVVADCQGNMEVLGKSFGNMMRSKPQFNQLMKALIGSYLSQHPEEKKEFIQALDITGVDPNMN